MPEQIDMSEYQVEYMITQDNQLVASINGQAHLPVDPIEYIRKQQAAFDVLYWQNARLSEELQNVTGTLQTERAWMIQVYALLGHILVRQMSTQDIIAIRQAAPEWLHKGTPHG